MTETTDTIAEELARLRSEVHLLTLAVGYLGNTLFAINGHRAPLELRQQMDAWDAHAVAVATPLGPNERRIGGFATNASMDAELEQAPQPGQPAPSVPADRWLPVTNGSYEVGS